MPLAMSLAARGGQVTGSKTTLDGVEGARESGIEIYPPRPERGWRGHGRALQALRTFV